MIDLTSRLIGETMKDGESLPSILNLARKLAHISREDKRVGSIIALSGRVLGRGFNKYFSINNLSRKFFSNYLGHEVYNSIHAEIMALKNSYKSKIRGATLYVCRIKKNGSLGLSKPCARCMNAIRELGISKIVYSTEVSPFFVIERI